MELKPGSRWKSAVCATELVIVQAPKAPAKLACGGSPVIALAEQPAPGLALDPGRSDGTLIGKRYVDEQTGLEVLCSKSGKGSVSVDGRALPMKQAKKLPSSD